MKTLTLWVLGLPMNKSTCIYMKVHFTLNPFSHNNLVCVQITFWLLWCGLESLIISLLCTCCMYCVLCFARSHLLLLYFPHKPIYQIVLMCVIFISFLITTPYHFVIKLLLDYLIGTLLFRITTLQHWEEPPLYVLLFRPCYFFQTAYVCFYIENT